MMNKNLVKLFENLLDDWISFSVTFVTTEIYQYRIKSEEVRFNYQEHYSVRVY